MGKRMRGCESGEKWSKAKNNNKGNLNEEEKLVEK